MKIIQERTLLGVLEFTPCRLMNDRAISQVREKALTTIPEPHVFIEPVRQSIPAHAFPFNHLNEAFGPRETLPGVVCFAMFSSSPVRNEREDESLLSVIWFQDKWALPIDRDITKHIQKIDWESLARNYVN